MIEIIIFQIHIIGALYAFTKNWQSRGLKEGVLAILIIGLIFAIGWALTNPLAWFIMPKSWSSIWFSQDTLSLVLLLVPESFFFYLFFIKDKN
ncbi:hypothetical protein ACFLSQ_07890 [Bacteroidota bacterium]